MRQIALPPFGRMHKLIVAAMLAAAVVSPASAQIAPTSPLARARVDKMLSSGHADETWFSASFLAQVKVAQIDAVLAQLRTGLGDYQGLDDNSTRYTARFAHGSDEVQIHLDGDQKIDSLSFEPVKLDLSAMEKLSFLKGAWVCTIRGGSSNGLVQDVQYSFSPDGLWMTELSDASGPNQDDWATQVWGYDVNVGKFVAYNFAANGVFTKSVDGWINGSFVSHRDDNGASVSVKPIDSNSMQWTIESADHSSIVREDCVRR
jgi:hypothetical protein